MPNSLIVKTNYNFQVEYSPQARKFLEKHVDLRDRFDDVILDLPQNADVKVIKGCKSKNRYRARVGNYRIVFDLYKDILLICIVSIDSRGQVYKHLK